MAALHRVCADRCTQPDASSVLPDDPLRASARVMCEDARARGVLVEELLVSLKRAWPTLIDRDRISHPHSSRLLAGIVTICVQEYHAA